MAVPLLLLFVLAGASPAQARSLHARGAVDAAPSGAPGPSALVNRASMLLETSYLLRANLNYGAGTISTTETIAIRNISGVAISKLNLSVMPRAFGELTAIGGFTVDGRAVSAAWTNNANLELQLGRNVYAGQSARVSLRFAVRASGTIGTSLEGRLSKANGIMQVSHWFPIISNGHPARYPGDSQYTRTARKIRLELTTDSSSIRIAAPGTRAAYADRYHVYEMLNARDFAFGASPYYRVVSGSAGGVAVSAFYTSGSGSAALSYAMSALVKFEAAYGQYQWPRFVVAQTGRASSGNEYPGIIFLGGPLFSNREVVVHETAHQWWYGMAGNDQMGEPWLDEGFSEFSTAYFYSGFEPYASTRPVNSSIYEFPNIPAPLTTTEPNSYDQTVYFKAARFLNALRVQMGSTRFFGALRDLFAANRNGVVTTREFYDTMARYGASTSYMRQFIRL
jgi:hypothetical protein